jgi:hypothetical protein
MTHYKAWSAAESHSVASTRLSLLNAYWIVLLEINNKLLVFHGTWFPAKIGINTTKTSSPAE